MITEKEFSSSSRLTYCLEELIHVAFLKIRGELQAEIKVEVFHIIED